MREHICSVCGNKIPPTPNGHGSYYYNKTCSRECAHSILSETGKTNGKKNAYLGIVSAKETKAHREMEFAQKLHNKFPQFRYLSGYDNCESVVTIKCEECGITLQRNAQAVRGNANLECSNCLKIKNIKEHKTQKSNRKTPSKTHQTEMRVCQWCGTVFIPQNRMRSFCCEEHKRKLTNARNWKTKEVVRRRRVRDNGPVQQIALNQLVIRDASVCHLCGGLVDMNQEPNQDTYGSIDHVMPVAKGGTHTWDNVKLAHRRCNYMKSDNLAYANKEWCDMARTQTPYLF